MPFKSSKQRAYLFAKKPEVAEKFAEHGMKHEKGEGKAHERKEKKKHQVAAIKKMLK